MHSEVVHSPELEKSLKAFQRYHTMDIIPKHCYGIESEEKIVISEFPMRIILDIIFEKNCS